MPFIVNSFPTITFVNHFSIATGLHPESTGVIAKEFYDERYNSVLKIKDAERYFKHSQTIAPIWVSI